MAKSVIALLEAALASSRLELAEFGKIWPPENGLPYPTSEKEVTPFIRERTKIYRESWLITPLELALEALRGYDPIKKEIK